MLPISTKNHFNINIEPLIIQNQQETHSNQGNYNDYMNNMRNQNNFDNILNHTKEINMHNKILINDIENSENKNQSTPNFKSKIEDGIFENSENKINLNTSEFNRNYSVTLSDKRNDISSARKMSINIDVVNESDTKKIFNENVQEINHDYQKKLSSNQENYEKNSEEILKKKLEIDENMNKIKLEKKNVQLDDKNIKSLLIIDDNPIISDNQEEYFNINKDIKDYIKNNQMDIKFENNNNIIQRFSNEKINKYIFNPMISPSRASLNISPKSAFVFNKKSSK